MGKVYSKYRLNKYQSLYKNISHQNAANDQSEQNTAEYSVKKYKLRVL